MKLGIISDIHEDIVSLKSILNTLEKRGCDEIICLGDIVGYIGSYFDFPGTRNASECLRLIRTNCSHVLTGNHDLFAVRKLPIFRGGYRFPGNWYNLSIEERKKFSKGLIWLYEDELTSNLDHRDSEYVSKLPEYIIKSDKGINFMFSHFLFPSLTGSESHSPTQKQNLNKHFSFMRRMECDYSFFGHVHTAGIVICNEPQLNIFPTLGQPFEVLPFGDYKLKNRVQSIGLPAVADSGKKNGAALFDTDNFEISVIPVNETISHYRKA